MTTPNPKPASPPSPSSLVPPKFSAATLAKDVGVYGGAMVAALTIAFHSIPGAQVPAGVQVVLTAVVPILTGILSAMKQSETASTVAKATASLQAALDLHKGLLRDSIAQGAASADSEAEALAALKHETRRRQSAERQMRMAKMTDKQPEVEKAPAKAKTPARKRVTGK